MKSLAIYVTFLFVILFSSPIFSITVDGDLSDWGLVPGTDYDAYPGIHSWVEDFVDYNNNGYVGPGYGGQPYDFEGLYVSIEGDNMYVAMILGMPPTGSGAVSQPGGTPNNSPFYYPGDLAMDLNGDGFFEYGLELTGHSDNTKGGVAGNGEYTYDPSKKGNLYRILNSHGWNKGLKISGYTEAEINHRREDALELAGNTQVEYLSSDDPEHYVVETFIPLQLLEYDPDSDFYLHWTQTCGNDMGDLFFSLPEDIPPSIIPEPLTVLLMCFGLSGLFLKRAYRKK